MNDPVVSDRRYFTIIPNLVDDLGLSVYAYRLYGHIKRVTGEDGVCWQSTARLAAVCGMSVGMVSACKKELAEAKLIEIREVASEHPGRPYHEIRLVDIWVRNMQHFAQTSPGELQSSSHELQGSSHELHSSPGETKKNPVKKNPLRRTQEEERRSEAPLPAEQEQMIHCLAHVTDMDESANYGRLKREASALLRAGYSVPQVFEIYRPGAGRWYRHDWRGKKRETPSLGNIRATIKQLAEDAYAEVGSDGWHREQVRHYKEWEE